MLKNILIVAAGGAVGSGLRYLVSGAAQRAGGAFPWGTLAVNMIGCFVIGLLWEVFDRTTLSPSLRMLLMVGVLGGFTTFSTYGLETMKLLQDGEMGRAALNVLASTAGGLVLVYAGLVAGRALLALAK